MTAHKKDKPITVGKQARRKQITIKPSRNSTRAQKDKRAQAAVRDACERAKPKDSVPGMTSCPECGLHIYGLWVLPDKVTRRNYVCSRCGHGWRANMRPTRVAYRD